MSHNDARDIRGCARNPPQQDHKDGKFPPLFYLDHDLFMQRNASVPGYKIKPPDELFDILQNKACVLEDLASYFTTVHSWMPIVSKRRLEQTVLQNLLWDQPADLLLLLLCVKLIISRPVLGNMPACMRTYQVSVDFLASLATTGPITLRLVQAATLVALYEVAHAIYPSAYLTVGQSVRLAYSAGLHTKSSSTPMLGQSSTWTEVEERRRVYWGVLILDRFVCASQTYKIFAAGAYEP